MQKRSLWMPLAVLSCDPRLASFDSPLKSIPNCLIAFVVWILGSSHNVGRIKVALINSRCKYKGLWCYYGGTRHMFIPPGNVNGFSHNAHHRHHDVKASKMQVMIDLYAQDTVPVSQYSAHLTQCFTRRDWRPLQPPHITQERKRPEVQQHGLHPPAIKRHPDLKTW